MREDEYLCDGREKGDFLGLVFLDGLIFCG